MDFITLISVLPCIAPLGLYYILVDTNQVYPKIFSIHINTSVGNNLDYFYLLSFDVDHMLPCYINFHSPTLIPRLS